jgi:signal transduction histidine kinase
MELFSASFLAVSFILCLFAATMFALYYVPMSGTRFLRVTAFAEVAMMFALGSGTAQFQRAARPIRDWLARPPSPDGAAEAWQRTVEMPRLALQFALWRAVLFAAVPVTAMLAAEFRFPLTTIVLFFVGLLGAAIYPTVLFYFGLELYLRPVLRDLAPHLPEDFEPTARAISVRKRVLAALPLINVITGGFVGVLATLVTGGSVVDLGMWVVFSVVIALSFSLVLTVLVTHSLLDPVDELLSATHRITAGDLTTRAAVAGADEMGHLASSFNAMTAELVASRQRLVEAREEERRRLRRDLHDGLGPTLAAVILQLDTARSLVRTDPRASEALLGELRQQTQGALDEIRRLVYALRPPALDDLGLVRAIRERAQGFASANGGFNVTVDAPEQLPPLPAAVEVAAFRIIQEALTNVARHSGAHHCLVRLSANGQVELEVADDGCGFSPDRRAGVGLGSMRERAAEVGGRCDVVSEPGVGTWVRASLPAG